MDNQREKKKVPAVEGWFTMDPGEPRLICELVWQLRGEAKGRQVEGAKAGLTVNQGLFGHASSVIVKK